MEDGLLMPATIKVPLSKIPNTLTDLVEKEGGKESLYYMVHPLIGGVFLEGCGSDWRGRISIANDEEIIAFW